MYSLKIKDSNDTEINEITNWNKFNFNWEHNREDKANITLNLNTSKFNMTNLYAGKSYLDIYRYGVKIWSGILGDIIGSAGDITGEVTLTFYSYLWLLNFMFVSPAGKTFSSTDEGTILWTLIDDFQNLTTKSDFGITQGSNSTTSTNRDRTYPAFKNLYEAFIQMTEVENGPDVDIDQNKALQVWSERGRRTSFVFEYGKNIKNLDFSISMADFANSVYVLGSGEGQDQLYAVVHKASSQDEYKVWQKVMLHPSVIETETLREHASQYASEFSQPIDVYSATLKAEDPSFLSYQVGDEVKIKASYGWLDIDKWKRIKKIDVEVSPESYENVTLDFI